MANIKKRVAYGVEFMTPELIVAVGKSKNAVNVMINACGGDMEEVCRRYGIGDAEALKSALATVRAFNEADDDISRATEEICSILGIEGDEAEAVEEDERESDEAMDPEGEEEDPTEKALMLLKAYREAVMALRILSAALNDADAKENFVFSNQMQQLSELIETRCVNDFQSFIRIDWDSVYECVRATCS